MNWITIRLGGGRVCDHRRMLTHLWKVLVGQLHGPLSFRLILQPSMAIILAIRAGYEDASHFNRDYKRLFGIPPTRDVERLREMLRPAQTIEFRKLS